MWLFAQLLWISFLAQWRSSWMFVNFLRKATTYPPIQGGQVYWAKVDTFYPKISSQQANKVRVQEMKHNNFVQESRSSLSSGKTKAFTGTFLAIRYGISGTPGHEIYSFINVNSTNEVQGQKHCLGNLLLRCNCYASQSRYVWISFTENVTIWVLYELTRDRLYSSQRAFLFHRWAAGFVRWLLNR